MWVTNRPPPSPRSGGVGYFGVPGSSENPGGWVPQFTAAPPWLSKALPHPHHPLEILSSLYAAP